MTGVCPGNDAARPSAPTPSNAAATPRRGASASAPSASNTLPQPGTASATPFRSRLCAKTRGSCTALEALHAHRGERTQRSRAVPEQLVGWHEQRRGEQQTGRDSARDRGECERRIGRPSRACDEGDAARPARCERGQQHEVGPAREDLRRERERENRCAARTRACDRAVDRGQHARDPRRSVERGRRPGLGPRHHPAAVEQRRERSADGAGAEGAGQSRRQPPRPRDVREREHHEGGLRRQHQVHQIGRIQHAVLERREEGPAEAVVRIPERQVPGREPREAIRRIRAVVAEEVVHPGRTQLLEGRVERGRSDEEPESGRGERRDACEPAAAAHAARRSARTVTTSKRFTGTLHAAPGQRCARRAGRRSNVLRSRSAR